MLVCKYACMKVCMYASMHIYVILQVCKYASMQVCEYAIMQVCNHACMPVCMYIIVCKYSDQTLACPKGETKGELECGPAQSNLFSLLNLGIE